MENQCHFVSSRGLLKSCNIHSTSPASSCHEIIAEIYLQGYPRGASLYLCNSALSNFVDFILPQLSIPFVLVSGDSDNTMPYDALSPMQLNTLLKSPIVLHWFCQNLTIEHTKISHLPIGLDYHTLSKVGEQHPWGIGSLPTSQEEQLLAIASSAPPLPKRKLLCYSNFHFPFFGINQRGDRQQLLQDISHQLIFFEPQYVPRHVSWQHMSELAFVLSPKGGGLDCHRTWEALALGCIPILKSSGLDPLFRNLPVLIVREWKDVTQELLIRTLLTFQNIVFQKDKITLAYWVSAIKKAGEAEAEAIPSLPPL